MKSKCSGDGMFTDCVYRSGSNCTTTTRLKCIYRKPTEAVPKVCGTCNGTGAVMIGDDFYEHPEPCPTCTKQEEPKYGLEMCECCRDFEKCKKDGLVASSGFCPQYKHIGLSDVKEEAKPESEVDVPMALELLIRQGRVFESLISQGVNQAITQYSHDEYIKKLCEIRREIKILTKESKDEKI